MGRGQVSLEYLVIVGIALGLLIPAVFFFFSYNKQDTSSAIGAQINDIGYTLISTAKATYALGVNARRTVEFDMPEEVVRVYIGNGPDYNELVIQYQTPQGISDAVFFSDIELTSAFPEVDNTKNVSVVHAGRTRYELQALTGAIVNMTERVD